jgi:hypothetical protein
MFCDNHVKFVLAKLFRRNEYFDRFQRGSGGRRPRAAAVRWGREWKVLHCNSNYTVKGSVAGRRHAALAVDGQLSTWLLLHQSLESILSAKQLYYI